MTQSIWPPLLVFLLVLAAMPLAAMAIRRNQAGGAARGAVLGVVGSVAVGARERIALVRADRSWLVVGITSHTITLLSQLDEAPAGVEALESGAGATGFADVLRSISRHATTRR